MLARVVPFAGSNITPKTSIVAAPTGQENAQADMTSIRLTNRIDIVSKPTIVTDQEFINVPLLIKAPQYTCHKNNHISIATLWPS
jgi:hypothetical protein